MRKFLTFLILSFFIFSVSCSNFSLYNRNNPLAFDKVDYLVVGPAGLKATLSKLIDYRKVQDLDGIFVSIEDIIVATQGGSFQDKLRNYLIKNYKEWGLKYLLLVGSPSTIKTSYFFPKVNAYRDSTSSPGRTPSLYYYSNLTGDWDSNKNGFPGEFRADYFMDFLPDIFVGIIPFDDSPTVSKVIENTISFENKPLDYRLSFLLGGAMLGYKGEEFDGGLIYRMDGAEFQELLINRILAKKGFSSFRLYEREGFIPPIYESDMALNKNNFLSEIKKGYGVVSWNGHGNETGVYRAFWKTDYNKNNIPDDGYSWDTFYESDSQVSINGGIFIAESCLTAYPEHPDNLGYASLKKGATAYIGASRISWSPSYFTYPEDGGMDSIIYYFVNNLTDGKTIGESLYKALEHFKNQLFYKDLEDPIEANLMNLYDFNIYGDPALTLVKPEELKTPYFSIKNKRLNIYKQEEGYLDINYFNIENPSLNLLELPEGIAYQILSSTKGSFKLKFFASSITKQGLSKAKVELKNENLKLSKDFEINVFEERERNLELIFKEANNYEFEVEIQATNLKEGKTLGLQLVFNPHILEVLNATPDENLLLNKDDPLPVILIDNDYGEVGFYKDFSSIPKDTGIVKIRFLKRSKFSKTDLRLLNLKGILQNSKPPELTYYNGSHFVAKADIDKDGTLDGKDLTILKTHFTKTYMTPDEFNRDADLNSNYEIDGDDFVAFNLSKTGIDYEKGRDFVNSSSSLNVVSPQREVPLDEFSVELSFKNLDKNVKGFATKLFYDSQIVSFKNLESSPQIENILYQERNGILYIGGIFKTAEIFDKPILKLYFKGKKEGILDIDLSNSITRDEKGNASYLKSASLRLFVLKNPSLMLKVFLDDEAKIFDENLEIKGLTTSGAKVFINGVEVEVKKDGSFAYTIKLKPGLNEIKITAKLNNKEETVIRKVYYKSAPDLTVNLEEGKTYNDKTLIIIGKTDPGCEVKINGVDADTYPDGSFNFTYILKEGLNQIKIESKDTLGRITVVLRNIYLKIKYLISLQVGKQEMFVNGAKWLLDSPPVIIEGRTLVPIRAIVEAIGGSISWDGVERKVTINLGTTTIELWIGKNTAKVNGVSKPIDAANPKVVPQIISGRTMLPLRFVAENLGCKVDWNPTTKTVTITYPSP